MNLDTISPNRGHANSTDEATLNSAFGASIDAVEYGRGQLAALSRYSATSAREVHVLRLRYAFERAGIANQLRFALIVINLTLAELAVFQALSVTANVPEVTAQSPAQRWGSIVQPIVRDLIPVDGDLISILRSLGVPVQRATALEALGEVALKAGLMICLKGVAARLAVESWAKTIGRTAVLFDSTIGLIDTGALREILAGVPTHDVLALLDANLSALDIYARPISDLVLSRLTRPDSEPKPAILLALTEGVGSLPLPKTFESISASMNLDTRYIFRSASDLGEMMSMANDPEENTPYACLLRPAADRLQMQIEKLEPETRALVLSILITQ